MSGRIRLSRRLGAALVVLALGLLLVPGAALAGAKVEITDDSYVTLGMGLRTSYTNGEDGAPNGRDYSHNFDLESWRLYVGGQIMPHVLFEFNADYSGEGNASARGVDDSNDVKVLDGVIKLEFNDLVNIWAGRFLPPSDRANLSGPYFLDVYDFPFASKYPSIFAGRDEGAAYWGQIGGGMFKWQVGLFDGIEDPAGAGDTPAGVDDSDDLLWAGRVVLNLWDPEPGYYNSSIYYNDKDILAIGLAGQLQNSALVGDCSSTAVLNPGISDPNSALFGPTPAGCTDAADVGDFRAWNVDVLMQKHLGFGMVAFNGAYYDYDRDRKGTATNEGKAWFAVGSLLLPEKYGPGKWQGQLEPFVRFQEFDPRESGIRDHTRWDFGLNYVLSGHNARITAQYSRDKGSTDDHSSKNIYKLGLQFQL